MRANCLVILTTFSLHSLLFAADGNTVLVIHGGAGVLTDLELKSAGLSNEQFEQGLAQSLHAGFEARKRGQHGKSHIDAVEAAIRVLEDSELFNAGKGAAFNEDGHFELDAAIMEGNMVGNGNGKKDMRKRAGAVAAVMHIKNPISAARAVMEMLDNRHVLLVGNGAEWFALSEANKKQFDIERVDNAYFWSERRLEQLRERVFAKPGKGTVGAVALSEGHLAVGTSTGGLTGKLPGRVGDSPLIGAGTYADDRACGVSCTGTGEVFIRHAVAHDVVARMLYKKNDVATATKETIEELPDEDDGVGGLIALDAKGQHAFSISAKSLGMYRGYVTETGDIYVAIRSNDPYKRIRWVEKGKE